MENQSSEGRFLWPGVTVVCACIVGAGVYFGLKDSAPGNTDTQGVVVYVTRSGKKYHRASCSYLRKSKIPISLSEARGQYGPCSRCRPPN
jgi:hypothetical protein